MLMRWLLLVLLILVPAGSAGAAEADNAVTPQAVCPSCATVADPVVNWCRGCSWPLAEIRQSFHAWLVEEPPANHSGKWQFRHRPGPGSDTVSAELVLRGFAALDHGQLQGAENFARSALLRAVWNPDAYRVLARLSLRRHDRDAAAGYFTRLLEVAPMDREARDFLTGKSSAP